MDDEDFMDTDDIQHHAQNAAPAPYEISSSLNNSTSSDIMVTIPYVPGSEIIESQPYSFTITPGASGENGNSGTSAASSFRADMAAKAAISKSSEELLIANNIIDPKNSTADRQYMIKIDNNDGTPPYPLSITLPHNMNPTENTDSSKMITVATNPTMSNHMNGLIHSNQIQNNGMYDGGMINISHITTLVVIPNGFYYNFRCTSECISCTYVTKPNKQNPKSTDRPKWYIQYIQLYEHKQ